MDAKTVVKTPGLHKSSIAWSEGMDGRSRWGLNSHKEWTSFKQ